MQQFSRKLLSMTESTTSLLVWIPSLIKSEFKFWEKQQITCFNDMPAIAQSEEGRNLMLDTQTIDSSPMVDNLSRVVQQMWYCGARAPAATRHITPKRSARKSMENLLVKNGDKRERGLQGRMNLLMLLLLEQMKRISLNPLILIRKR